MFAHTKKLQGQDSNFLNDTFVKTKVFRYLYDE